MGGKGGGGVVTVILFNCLEPHTYLKCSTCIFYFFLFCFWTLAIKLGAVKFPKAILFDLYFRTFSIFFSFFNIFFFSLN